MVCLYHGDYGPADPAFASGAAAHFDGRGWAFDARLLKEVRNIEEAEAMERHLTRGESVSWCDQGYAWAEPDAVSWFYVAVFLFVVFPYLIFKIAARAKAGSTAPKHTTGGRSRHLLS